MQSIVILYFVKMTNSKYAFQLSDKLYLKDPLASTVGRKIILHGAPLFLEQGLEDFTVKKLAVRAGTTEATVYKYFKNKHRLLQYYFQLYWTWLEQQIKVFTAVIDKPEERLMKAVQIICDIPEVAADPGIVTKEDLRALVIAEGSKAYLTHHVDEDNAKKLFAPYKHLVAYLANMIQGASPAVPYPRSLATTIVEMSHSLEFYRMHLPSLTDFPGETNPAALKDFISLILTNSLFINRSEK